MSRLYDMHISITEFNGDKAAEIMDEAGKEWPDFDDNWFDAKELPEIPEFPRTLTSNGQDNLCGGESEEQFVLRVTKAIWKANGGFCRVKVNAVCLEDLPYEYHELDEEVYELTMKESDDE